MATGFEAGDRASARAAQAATSPAIWSVFPATIERRLKIFRCGNEFEEFISAADCPARNCSEPVSHVTALSPNWRAEGMVRRSPSAAKAVGLSVNRSGKPLPPKSSKNGGRFLLYSDAASRERPAKFIVARAGMGPSTPPRHSLRVWRDCAHM